MTQTEWFAEMRKTYNKMMLSKEEFAKELGCSQSTIDRLRKDGTVKGIKMGGQIRFKLDEVARVLSEVA